MNLGAEDIFSNFLTKENSNPFFDVLSNFVQEHKNKPSVDDIKEFIGANRGDLSKIKDGIENLLIGFVDIFALNSSQDIEDFFKLVDQFEIKNVTRFRECIIERVKRETIKNGKGDKKITNVFQSPKDLLSFYVEAHPELFDKIGKIDKIIDVADKYRQTRGCIFDDNDEYFDLFDLLRKYDSKTIADFVKSKPVSEDVIYLSTNVLIWASFFDNSIPWKLTEVFPNVKDLVDFYINKIPEQLKQNKRFSIFYFEYWDQYEKKLGIWDDYCKEVSDNKKHIDLFFNFFEGNMSLENKDISNTVRVYRMFSRFQSIEGFLDFYVTIYSKDMSYLQNKNGMRDIILRSIFFEYGSEITDFLSTTGNEEKYNFFIPHLINVVCDYKNCTMSDFSNIAKFLDKSTNLNQDLKNKLLKKIDDEGMGSIESLCSSNIYDNQNDFEISLNYATEIMESKSVLPETKYKIYQWVYRAYSNASIQRAGLMSSDKLNQDQTAALGNQILTLQNKLSATEFKFEWSWNLFVWFSGIGTIIRLVQRYLLKRNLLDAQSRQRILESQKQNLEKTKESMKKLEKSKENEDLPDDKHEKYCDGLKRIIDIYEQQLTNKSNDLILLYYQYKSNTNQTQIK